MARQRPISSISRSHQKSIVYRVPPGAEIRFKGGSVPVTNTLFIDVTPPDAEKAAIDIDDSAQYLAATRSAAAAASGSRPAPRPFAINARPKGFHLTVPAGFTAAATFDGSIWGTFTIALTIPIALFIGLYLHRFRKNRVLEASIIGGLLTLAAVYLGGLVADPASYFNIIADSFNLSEQQVGYSIVIYGFVASVLPVWLLLCPRDYLSSFLKIGTIALLIVGVIVAHPRLQAPAINHTSWAAARSCPGPSSPSSSSPSCAAPSPASMPWSPRAPRPR